MVPRKISKIVSPQATPGFLGQGHTAVSVLDGLTFDKTDPFILLMDDRVKLRGTEPAGGPHPHAGFETVTLVLEGHSGAESFNTGDLEWMTAGSGIIHTEEIVPPVDMRILQLWLTLPKAQRWAAPKWQKLGLDAVPTLRGNDHEIRVYSGSAFGLTAPTQNQTPVTLVEFRLQNGYATAQELPAGYNGFVYVLDGSLEAGSEKTRLQAGQVAWLNRPQETGNSQISWKAGENGAHFVLYAGEPQGVPIVNHGPFIADTKDELIHLYAEYRNGHMNHVNDLPEQQVIVHK